MDSYSAKVRALDEYEYCVHLPNGTFLFVPITSMEKASETSPYLKKALMGAIKALKADPRAQVPIFREKYNPITGWSEKPSPNYIIKVNPSKASKYPYLAITLFSTYGVTKDGIMSKNALPKSRK